MLPAESGLAESAAEPSGRYVPVRGQASIFRRIRQQFRGKGHASMLPTVTSTSRVAPAMSWLTLASSFVCRNPIVNRAGNLGQGLRQPRPPEAEHGHVVLHRPIGIGTIIILVPGQIQHLSTVGVTKANPLRCGQVLVPGERSQGANARRADDKVPTPVPVSPRECPHTGTSKGHWSGGQ